MRTLLRALPWWVFGPAAAVAAAVVTTQRSVPALRLAAALLAAAAGSLCDDPAEPVADATPTPRAVRRPFRWAAGAAAAYACWLALLPFAGDVPVAELAAELGLLLVLATAAGATLGGPAAAPGLLVALMAGSQLSPYVTHLRPAALAGGLLVLAAALRDPAARRRATPADEADAVGAA